MDCVLLRSVLMPGTFCAIMGGGASGGLAEWRKAAGHVRKVAEPGRGLS